MKTTALRVENYAAYRAPLVLEAAVPAAKPAANNGATEKGHGARKAALACAAPFIGLAFVVTAPFVGMVALAWIAAKAFAAAYPAAARAAKNITLFVAAPFIGLAYVAAFPFVGLGVIAWTAVKARA